MSDPTVAHIGWKIIELVDKPRFMFCGLNGSRDIPLNQWLHAEHKTVSDGRGTEYESGFHVIPRDLKSLQDYAKRFKNFDGKVVVQVVYQDAAPKPTKNSLALLADRILLWATDLETAMPLELAVTSSQRP